jgi:hypothetical protein
MVFKIPAQTNAPAEKVRGIACTIRCIKKTPCLHPLTYGTRCPSEVHIAYDEHSDGWIREQPCYED